MSQFIIKGGKALRGEIEVRGAKNAATPILAATLLTKEECIIDNIPKILDVLRLIEILQSMGVDLEWLGEHKLRIQAKDLSLAKMNKVNISKMRSSILLAGPLLARLGETTIARPGGCKIGVRPIDTHLQALENLGAKIQQRKDAYFLKTEKLTGKEFVMSEFSVTATENALMTAVLAKGQTTMYCAASDIYIQDLVKFLNKMGAKIQGIGTHTLKIQGVKKLHGAKHKIIPDPIEMGTFVCLAAATRSNIVIRNFKPEFLKIELLKYKQAGVNFEINKSQIKIMPSKQLKAVNVHNMPHPGFTADLLQPFAVLMTQAQGTSLIHDWMYEKRQKYVDDLNKMGANCTICDPHRVLITGPTPLNGQEITSYDIRSGATLIIAALVAQGQSVISEIEQVDRGYEKIEERLQKLGADIQRI